MPTNAQNSAALASRPPLPIPNEPDGVFQPPPRPRCYELLIKQAADKLKITCIPNRLSILTQPLNGRPACHYCGPCEYGCITRSYFNSPGTTCCTAQSAGFGVITGTSTPRQLQLGLHFAF